MTADNHWSYKNSNAVAAVIVDRGAKLKYIRACCLWQNRKVATDRSTVTKLTAGSNSRCGYSGPGRLSRG